MPRIDHILFPYDFSPPGNQGAAYVRALANRLHARVTVCSVVPPLSELALDGLGPRVGEDHGEWKRALQSRLDQALRTELAGIPVNRVTDAGDPAETLVRFAAENDVDLIMMPTHGLGTFRSMLVGSVTSKVLHDATCPVWTAAHTDTQTAHHLPQTILCAVDGGADTAALLRWASGFSADVGAALKLLHVVGPVTDWPPLGIEHALQDQIRQQAQSTVAGMMREVGLDAPLRVAIGRIAQTIVEEARSDCADLVIIGRGSMTQPLGRLRTHAVGIIQRARCPVISVLDNI